MNKADSAAYLGCSTRSLERYISTGRLHPARVRGKTGPALDLDQADLDRLKVELDAPAAPPAPAINGRVVVPPEMAPASPQAANARPVAGDSYDATIATMPRPRAATVRPGAGQLATIDSTALAIVTEHVTALAGVAEQLAAVAAAQQAPARPDVPTADKLMLTLDEAQALTGLSRAYLRAAITAGELDAKRIGRAWRVKRSTLEAYIETL